MVSPSTNARRRVAYITGSRADFGLMRPTLEAMAASPKLDLSVIATGMHLCEGYGGTISEVRGSGVNVVATVPVGNEPPTGAAMARDIGRMTIGMVDALQANAPDLVLLLGDRGEMLAGAIAGLHLDIAVAHIHGGDRSGTVDEPVRHAISKLSHIHFTATNASRQRLIRMGEVPDHVVTVGAPGLDGLTELATSSRAELCAAIGFDPKGKIALVVYHPDVEEHASAAIHALIAELRALGAQIVALAPNSDRGSEPVREAMKAMAADDTIHLALHLPRDVFISWMACADIMAGNSSAGIIEAASFGTPVLNVGGRQALRERNANVRDVTDETDRAALRAAMSAILDAGRLAPANIYGEGMASERITRWIEQSDLAPELLRKRNAY